MKYFTLFLLRGITAPFAFSQDFCNGAKPSEVQNINNDNSIGDLHIENSFIVLLRAINFTGTMYTKIHFLENEQYILWLR